MIDGPCRMRGLMLPADIVYKRDGGDLRVGGDEMVKGLIYDIDKQLLEIMYCLLLRHDYEFPKGWSRSLG